MSVFLKEQERFRAWVFYSRVAVNFMSILYKNLVANRVCCSQSSKYLLNDCSEELQYTDMKTIL